ncbi:MAG: neutral/alkaline non-lysosomal ceramidase N-terminal domain-containing protein [Bryobacterales bacterium]|nr:neutral/alkaline non-lysosomal ceramidase N-terminal domain-containing protein [Bryobacterales bacterium]
MTARALLLGVAAAILAAAAPKPEFRAGAAVADITPAGPIWMSGYAARKAPSEGAAEPLHAKALAMEDRKGSRVVIVTTDLIGLPREITDQVAARLGQDQDLRRAQVLFNSSHTHAGPIVWPNLRPLFALDAAQQKIAEAYARRLTDELYRVAIAALSKMEPATLHYSEGKAGFAANRREFRKEKVQFGVNPNGPVDHTVPVVDVRSANGKRLAILFGYTCHNTTLAADFLKLSGDYAGAAQRELEARFPGATALFLMLCGADQNPEPRGQPEHVAAHGKQLADGVAQALGGAATELRAPLKTAFQLTSLAFAPHSREQFEEEAKHQDVFRARRARLMLERYDAGQPMTKTPYPVQGIRFGKQLTILALGGEAVVDYQLRARRLYPEEKLIVAGYSNDVMCYIPSLRVLREGGYEAGESMIYYGMPGKFTEEVEETVFASVRRVLQQVGVN